MSICNIDKKKWIGLAVISAICYIMIFILPIEYNVSNDGKTIFPGGPSLYLVYSMCGIGSLINLFICFFYQKKIPNKKFIPLYSLLLLGGLAFVIVIAFPDLFLIGFVFCLIDLIMFFTIENPDVKMLEQVEIARDAAERANRAKSDFLSNMSHEIRTPLNAIVGFSECILEEDDLDKAKGDAKDIVIASQNLLEIVNGILDISKIEANKMEIVETEYNLKENLNNLAKLMIPRIGEKPIELKVKMADDIPETLYGDGGKIRQIVSNILTNAVKYTEKGLITLDVNCVNKDGKCSLVISVEDTGRGIKPEKIDTIFQKFERLEEDRNTTLEGTGLGLAITKRLVEMLGGKIVVQSKYGTGSKFTVYLKQEIRNTVHKKEEDYNINQGNFDVKGKKILVVDDNKVNLKLANRLLQSFEVDVDLVESGMDCLSKINAGYKYDLILMDDMMPNMTGTETFKQLKELADFSTPVVVLTANAIEGMKDEYLNTGFNDYLAKPIDRLELERVLRTYLSSNVVQNQLVSKFEPLPDDIYNMDKPLNEKRDNS
jgi:signal transduction histidine kinase/CheY-like chemotaxis protein